MFHDVAAASLLLTYLVFGGARDVIARKTHHDCLDKGPGHPAESDARDAALGGGDPGLVVVNTGEGVLLKPLSAFAETRPEEVFGCLAWHGPAKSLADMDARILAEAERRHASD